MKGKLYLLTLIMKSMNESLLQYAWQCKHFKMTQIQTVDGIPLEIIDVGQLNKDAGPDFFNAKVKIGTTMWAGNIEIHLSASDWYRHHHENDLRYDSIILHVVEKSDMRIYRKNGEVIPQMVIELEANMKRNYDLLSQSNGWIRCSALWTNIDKDYLNFQLTRMICERIHRKSREIAQLLESNKNDWSSTFYLVLLKSFGMHTNALPFELLAKSLPLRVLAKHKNNLMEVEALLLGQAGLLHDQPQDEYEATLRKHYDYLRKKFELTPIDGTLWKYSKMRPSNFPHVKIAQFAALIHVSDHLFSKIMESKSNEQIRNLFQCKTSLYWESHYKFGKESAHRSKHLDDSTINTLIINAAVPLLYIYGEKHENQTMQESVLQLLEGIPPEKNNIIERWKELGQEVSNAYQSQALIELKTQYCDLNKCLCCSIGHHLLSNKKTRDNR